MNQTNFRDNAENTINMTNLIISTIVAALVIAIALISVQNASLVSLQFVFWHSIELPWGLMLAGAVGLGLIIGGYLPLLGSNSDADKRVKTRNK